MRSKTFEEVAKRHFFEFFFGFSLKGLRPLNNPEIFDRLSGAAKAAPLFCCNTQEPTL